MKAARLSQRRVHQQGFTLIELLVCLGIIAVLFALTFVNLGRPQETASLDGTMNVLLADIKNQQILAMTGDTGGTGSAQSQGIYLQSSSFTLFAGATYNPSDPNNFTEAGGTGIQLTTTLPSSTLLFDKGTGEVSGYTPGSNTITLASQNTSQTITISRFGAITVN